MLGPVTVDGDGEPLAPRDRVVLAALAMSPREAVSADRLAEALWDEDPPPTWTKVVQGSVSRIRKALGPDAVRTSRQGYVLDLPDDAVDGLKFRQLVGRGRELLALHEADRARFVLTQALELWHGPALADLEGWTPGETAAAHWEEMRRDAEELRVEAALQAGGSREVLAEAGRLVSDQPYRENRWALWARAQYQAGRQGEALATLQRARAVLAGDLGLDPGPELSDLEQSILHQDPSLLPASEEHAAAVCPYRGLLAYDVDHAEQFFGRDDEVSACLETLAARHVVAVVGPSGSGKSSLVRAGVAARLSAAGRSVTVMTPGPHPMAALAAADGARRRAVLVVDQLEEAVTLCADLDERRAFLDALVEHADAGADLVLTLRADRLAGLSDHRPLARLLERGLRLLGPMAEADLRSAVEGPARQAGLLLEPGLVDLLVNEVAGEAGALPLMSHALAETWARREGRTMTVEGYRASGGIQGAVARSAEEVFLGLDEQDQRAARALLLRLVMPVSNGEPTRTRIPRRVVASDDSHEELVEMLVGARLITSDGETVELAHEALARAWPRLRGWLDADTEGQLLLRHLTTAADAWEAMGRPDSELYRGSRLARVTEWRPTMAADLTRTERDFLDASEALARAEARSAEERLQQQRRTNRRLRALLVGAMVLAVVAASAGALALRESSRADTQAQLATVRELAAASRAARAEDPQLAVLLALEATDPSLGGDEPAAEAVEALHLAVASSRLDLVVEDAGGTVAWSPDGRLFTSEGPEDSGLVEVFDATTGEQTASFVGHEIDVNDVAFGPDGQVATTGDDGAVRVWDVDGETMLAEMTGRGEVWSPTFAMRGPTRFAATWPEEGLIRVATVGRDGSTSVKTHGFSGWLGEIQLSPDGTWLAVATGDPPDALVIDARTGEVRRTFGRGQAPVRAVEISPDGRSVAVGTVDGGLRVHDAGTGRLLHDLGEVDSGILALAWSPDSRRLAVSEEQGDVHVHEVTPSGAGSTLRLSASTSGGMVGLAFSPEGTHLLGGDMGVSAARIWDVSPAGDAEVRNIRGVEGASGVAFGPDGRLFTTGRGASVVGYDADDDEPAVRLRAPRSQEFGALTVSPDGGTLAIGFSAEGSVVWDADSGEQLFATRRHPDRGWRWAPAFSPDGQLVALANDSRLDVHSLDGEVVAQLEAGDGFWFRDPVFSPDGEVVAVLRSPSDRGRPDGWDVVWWNWRSDEVRTTPTAIGHEPAFSPDGSRLAVAAVGEDTRLLDVATGEQVAVLDGHVSGVINLAYSPDGSRIATAGLDGLTILWDADDGEQLLQLPPSEHEVSSVAFSPDGRHLATDSVATDVVRVWTLDVEELREIGAAEVHRELTPSECRRYLHRACDA